ncbi:MAG: 50S ribosomal protein L18Ae [Candidatus Hodarchaeota archaeon]|jgi:large subunit ribosomal protein LX
MSVKIFRLRGTYGTKKKKSVFNCEIRAMNEKEAKERLYSELGSKHRIKRHLVNIKDTKLIKDVEDIHDPIVKSLTKGEVSALRKI